MTGSRLPRLLQNFERAARTLRDRPEMRTLGRFSHPPEHARRQPAAQKLRLRAKRFVAQTRRFSPALQVGEIHVGGQVLLPESLVDFRPDDPLVAAIPAQSAVWPPVVKTGRNVAVINRQHPPAFPLANAIFQPTPIRQMHLDPLTLPSPRNPAAVPANLQSPHRDSPRLPASKPEPPATARPPARGAVARTGTRPRTRWKTPARLRLAAASAEPMSACHRTLFPR